MSSLKFSKKTIEDSRLISNKKAPNKTISFRLTLLMYEALVGGINPVPFACCHDESIVRPDQGAGWDELVSQHYVGRPCFSPLVWIKLATDGSFFYDPILGVGFNRNFLRLIISQGIPDGCLFSLIRK